jgi:glycine hydroxymethyltransferase
LNPDEEYARVLQLVDEHHRWFEESIPLIASENVTSPRCREMLLTDFGHRYAEGWPGERLYAGTKYIDQVELIAIELLKELYGATFVDIRPVSGTTANIAAYTAFTEAGDTIMATSIPRGGHITIGPKHLGGTAGAVCRLNVEYFPYIEDEFAVDVDKTKQKIELLNKNGKRVALAVFGGSVFLTRRQAPLRELADFIRAQNGFVMYDAAHVLGLIIKDGVFQDPLQEGADIVTGSTHKTFFSVQHGIILSHEKYAERIKKAVFPGVVSNHHLGSVAAIAITACEYLKYGRDYARQVVRNARALAETLYEQGLQVIGAHWNPPFTETHTVLVDVVELGGGLKCEQLLERANIIVNRNMIPRDIREKRHANDPGGIRLGTSEVTRLGMKEDHLRQIAELIADVLIKKMEPEKVKERVRELKREFQHVRYAIEEGPAYKRPRLVF